MAWQNEMTRLLRFQIDDLNCDTYNDAIIEEAILVGSQFVLNEAEFDTTYIVDVDLYSLSPDPTELATKDNAFINLAVLKAACILLRGEVKRASAQSIKIIDGPSTIDASNYQKSLADAVAEVCKEYQVKLHEHRLDYSGQAGEVITTPITVDSLSHRIFRNFN